MEYPESEKLAAVAPFSQKIGEFIEWLSEKDMLIGKWCNNGIRVDVARFNKQELLAEFFEIDLKKVEKEREQMLAYLQEKPDV